MPSLMAADTGSKRPLAVVFDVGGVLCPNPVHEFDKVDAEYSLPSGTAQTYFRGGSAFALCETGQMSLGDFSASVSADIKATHGEVVPAARLESMLDACFSDVRPEMMTLLRQLRAAGHQLGLLTNIYAERREWLRRRFPPDLIDAYGDSSELGLRKPDPHIYVRVLELLGRRACEVVFVDDFIENIEPAKTLGMTTILFQNPLQVGQMLRTVGIETLDAA